MSNLSVNHVSFVLCTWRGQIPAIALSGCRGTRVCVFASLWVQRPDGRTTNGVQRPDGRTTNGVQRPDGRTTNGVQRPHGRTTNGVQRPDGRTTNGVQRPHGRTTNVRSDAVSPAKRGTLATGQFICTGRAAPLCGPTSGAALAIGFRISCPSSLVWLRLPAIVRCSIIRKALSRQLLPAGDLRE